ncbi:unnamed protein product [Trifolium pratense]|uniref:Uncharacterized protein n=1 Tax=Trifolium pratense TaxID=57577 RepID=A0ACB0J8R9_TRIPR|nr:unnamed protein product [Trifolium pratense]
MIQSLTKHLFNKKKVKGCLRTSGVAAKAAFLLLNSSSSEKHHRLARTAACSACVCCSFPYPTILDHSFTLSRVLCSPPPKKKRLQLFRSEAGFLSYLTLYIV